MKSDVWLMELMNDTRLSGTERMVYIALNSFTDNDGQCYPSIKSVAGRAGFSERSVKYAFITLKKTGWVQPLHQTTLKTTLYQLKKPDVGNPCTERHLSSTMMQVEMPISATLAPIKVQTASQQTIPPDVCNPCIDSAIQQPVMLSETPISATLAPNLISLEDSLVQEKERTTEKTKRKKGTGKENLELFDAYIVLAYLNDKAHRKFRMKPESVEKIQARLKKGETVEDLCLIIDWKQYQWGTDLKMKPFVNNTTLFLPIHYETYLEEAKAWDERRKKAPLNMMMDVPKGEPFTDEERKGAKENLLAGFGDGPDGDDPIQLMTGKET